MERRRWRGFKEEGGETDGKGWIWFEELDKSESEVEEVGERGERGWRKRWCSLRRKRRKGDFDCSQNQMRVESSGVEGVGSNQ